MKKIFLLFLALLLFICSTLLFWSCKNKGVNGPYSINLKLAYDTTPSQTERNKTEEILKERLNTYGFTGKDYHIEHAGEHINITINNADDSNRIRQLILLQGKLSFGLVYSYAELYNSFQEAHKLSRNLSNIPSGKAYNKTNPLTTDSIGLLSFLDSLNYNIVWSAHESDTTSVSMILNEKKIKSLFPIDILFKWKNGGFLKKDINMVDLFAIKGNSIIALSAEKGEIFAKQKFEYRNELNISIKNTQFSQKLKELTSKNINESMAFLVDDDLIIIAQIVTQIDNGQLSVGSIIEQEQGRLVTIILSNGCLPARLKIISEKIETKN